MNVVDLTVDADYFATARRTDQWSSSLQTTTALTQQLIGPSEVDPADIAHLTWGGDQFLA